MTEKTCQSCHHFIQHYGIFDGIVRKIYCGHCTHPKHQSKRPDRKACADYAADPSQTGTLVTKRFLTKELLTYVLNLDLWPDDQETI